LIQGWIGRLDRKPREDSVGGRGLSLVFKGGSGKEVKGGVVVLWARKAVNMKNRGKNLLKKNERIRRGEKKTHR